ncbi:MAG: GAF domain-containing protein [Gammaproteobacteria bacterium]|nr:GAF domain-containing protein [Gammaproteobacteria bacterium]
MSERDENGLAGMDLVEVMAALGGLEYQTGELDDYLVRIAESVSRLLGIEWSVVTLSDTPGQDRILASSRDIGEAANQTYSLHGTVTARVMDCGKPLCVADTRAAPEQGTLPEGYRAYIGVPLRVSDGTTIGTICSFDAKPREFSPVQVQVASLFAERAAAAIERFFAFRELKVFNEGLEALVDERTVELKQAQQQLVQQERLAAIGEFASMITHEIRSPLSTIEMALGYLQDSDLPNDAAKRVRLASKESGRLQSLLSQILLFAKPHAMLREGLDVDVLLRDVIDTVAEWPEHANRRIDYVCRSLSPAVHGDRDKLTQVVANLLLNALQATVSGQLVSVLLDDARDGLRLEVRNPGTIPDADLARLTKPFFTTKSRGTGLGLAIVQRIVEAHAGHLQIGSDRTHGVSVVVTLPGNTRQAAQ